MEISFGQEDAFEAPAGPLFELAFGVPLQGIRLDISDNYTMRIREGAFAPLAPQITAQFGVCKMY